ncbi:uncharacterized protein C2orf72 homolog [Carettochelys insculpta]|uniref:uncharacterized protein C2orf72 homolog n=1 Tax=Carettochelys insculpta TaxID=44489 RepID=UPI003EB8D9EC
MEGAPPEEQALREFQALVELVGGKPEVLLVGEVLEGGETRALLGAFAQELFGEQPCSGATPGAEPGEQPCSGAQPAPRVRVYLGPCSRGREIRSPLVFLLCPAGCLRPRRARARLREIARDLRSRLPRAPPPALVGVIVQPGPGEEAAARPLLEALLREVFQGRRQGAAPPGGLQDTVQAAAYSPGRPDGPLEVRAAACRALRAALQRGAGAEDREKQRLPSILRCVPWGRRSQSRGSSAKATNDIHEGGLQDPEEGVALTSILPNGKCEEAGRGAGP